MRGDVVVVSGSVARHPLQPKTNPRGTHAPRFEAIRPWVEGKTVLDIGAACGKFRPDWMHRLVDAAAARSVAVDILPEQVEEMRELGFEAVQGNAECLDLGERFDVVLAGELIEHLANPGMLLESAQRHLVDGGVLVLTTPNAMTFTNMLYRLGKREAPINRDHVVWFCEDTLRALLTRSGWTVQHMGYIEHATPGAGRNLLAKGSRAVLPDRLGWRTLLAIASYGVA